MNKLNLRQFGRDVSLDGAFYTTTKPWAFPNLTLVDGFNVSTQFTLLNSGQTLTNQAATALGVTVAGNTADITTNANRMNTIIDAGDTLDTISELKAAWEGGDSTLTTAIASLTTVASTDRALIRAEHQTDHLATIAAYGLSDNAIFASL